MFVMLSVHTLTSVRERQSKIQNKSFITPTTSLSATALITPNKSDLNKNINEFMVNENKDTVNIDKCAKFNLISSNNSSKTSITTPSRLSLRSKTLPSELSFVHLNNFKKQKAVQVPVSTILNDLSPNCVQIKYKHKNNLMSSMTPPGLTNNTPDFKAMRYYRLWIYTCNAVLLMAVIVFCAVAGKILLLDYRRLLINGLNLTHPSFIYAYLALLVQSGFLQLVGCLGALRLSEKLLNAYWILLLVLLLGDALLGIFWIYKFDKVMHELKPILRYRLANDYGKSVEFTELWDKMQIDERCCGVSGPQDFPLLTNMTYPTSCCTQEVTEQQIRVSRRPIVSAVVYRDETITKEQQRNLTDRADLALSHILTTTRDSPSNNAVSSELFSTNHDKNKNMITTCRAVYPQGCKEKLVKWLRNTADVLFVIGYCVISFLKITFLGILRYEIKEMIQKIKLLQAEMATAILQGECAINVSADYSVCSDHKDRDKNFIGANECERESLLLHDKPTPEKNKKLYRCISEQGGGNVLITNSNRTLIVEDIPKSQLSSSTESARCASIDKSRQQPTTSSVTLAGVQRTINGNNNYELTDFDEKRPNYSHTTETLVDQAYECTNSDQNLTTVLFNTIIW
ncbi:uncharacterized protein LOC134836774 [Culicoides brevitarsis]|uniref:uncharacterized protein LOC134836774 n=1 Tax=Culicoides brevitarsis TaxID=469753 RepID=UPI00307B1ED7